MSVRRASGSPLVLGAPLSGRATGALARQHGRRVAGAASRAEFEALLRARSVPAFEALFAFEDAFGGFIGSSLELGAVAVHRSPANEGLWRRVTAEGAPLVAVGRGADGPYFLDQQGAIYGLAWSEVHPSWRSASAAGLIETLALVDEARAFGRAAIEVELDARCAEAIANALGVPRDPESADHVSGAWQDAGLTILTGQLRDGALLPAANGTVLFARTVNTAVEALRAAARVHPGVRARITAARLDEASAPPTAAPDPRPAELEADPSALELGYATVRDGEGGSVWTRGSGREARIDQLVMFHDHVLCWDRFVDAAGARVHFTGAAASLTGRVSARALRLIEAGHGRRDPRRVCDRAELERLLVSRGVPVFEVLVDFEAQFCGLELNLGASYTFGICSGLRFPSVPALIVHDGVQLVPIGTHEDTTYLADEHGAVYTQPFEGPIERVADSAADLLDDLAFCLGYDPSPEPRD